MQRRSIFSTGIGAAALALSASMSAAQMVLPDNRARIPVPPILREMDRRTRKRVEERVTKRAINEANRKENRDRLRRKRQRLTTDDAEFHIRRMTNWQHTRWSRDPARRDALGKFDPAVAARWANTPRAA